MFTPSYHILTSFVYLHPKWFAIDQCTIDNFIPVYCATSLTCSLYTQIEKKISSKKINFLEISGKFHVYDDV